MLYGFGGQLLSGLVVTLQVAAVALPMGVLIGLLGGGVRAYGSSLPRALVGGIRLFSAACRSFWLFFLCTTAVHTW